MHPRLKHVTDTDDDPPVPSVCPPLIQEVVRINCRVGNTEVSRVSEIEEIGAELQTLILTNPRVLQNSEINVVDSVGAQDISSGIANSLCSCNPSE